MSLLRLENKYVQLLAFLSAMAYEMQMEARGDYGDFTFSHSPCVGWKYSSHQKTMRMKVITRVDRAKREQIQFFDDILEMLPQPWIVYTELDILNVYWVLVSDR